MPLPEEEGGARQVTIRAVSCKCLGKPDGGQMTGLATENGR